MSDLILPGDIFPASIRPGHQPTVADNLMSEISQLREFVKMHQIRANQLVMMLLEAINQHGQDGVLVLASPTLQGKHTLSIRPDAVGGVALVSEPEQPDEPKDETHKGNRQVVEPI
jgi:hypothetical protein